MPSFGWPKFSLRLCMDCDSLLIPPAPNSNSIDINFGINRSSLHLSLISYLFRNHVHIVD